MIVAPLLLGYALLLATVAAPAMRRADWIDRAPRLALFSWFTLAATSLLAVMLAGLVLVAPSIHLGGDLAGFLHTCLTALRLHYGTAGGWLVGGIGLALLIVVPARVVIAAAVVISRTRRRRRRHLRALALTARPDPASGIWYVDHAAALAYCLPGSGGTVVVTTGARRAVDAAGFDAVLAHERAHLAGRHHLLTMWGQVLRAAMPWLPLFAQLPREISRLVELRADDVAADAASRRTIAGALLAFAESSAIGTPAPALAASGSDTLRRVERLLTGRGRLPGAGIGGVVSAAAIGLAIPVMVAIIPAITAVAVPCCST